MGKTGFEEECAKGNIDIQGTQTTCGVRRKTQE